jgi:LacI family transcriptional regulator
MRFRQATGHSIHDEIQNARLTLVCRLLRETNLHIGEITEQCGFMSDSYLGLVFRQTHQMSMSQYRRKSRNDK